jgi:hypothetical protein
MPSLRSAVRSTVPDPLLAKAQELLAGAPAARAALHAARDRGRAEAPRNALRPLLRSLARDCHSVLDVGTGLMQSLVDVPCRVRIGLDAHRPYLERRRDRQAVPINASAVDLERLFVANAVDLVQLIDVIEHFEPEDADVLLRQATTVAARRVVLFTPRGHFPQAGFDATGLGGEELQRHRSAWEPEDLQARGFNVIVLRAFHGPWNQSFVEAFGARAPPVDALLAFSEASQGPRASSRRQGFRSGT